MHKNLDSEIRVPSIITEPFIEINATIKNIEKELWKSVAKPLLKKIIFSLPLYDSPSIRDGLFQELTKDIFAPLTAMIYPFYKNPDLIDNHLDLCPHESLITVLWSMPNGLQMKIDSPSSDWVDISPQPGYVFVNLGKALNLITGGLCQSPSLRLRLPSKALLTFGAFYNPSLEYSFKNLISNELLYNGDYPKYLTEHFLDEPDDSLELFWIK